MQCLFTTSTEEQNALFRVTSNEVVLRRYVHINRDLNRIYDSLGTSMTALQDVMGIAKDQCTQLSILSEKINFLQPLQ
jgi:hypothetical protein